MALTVQADHCRKHIKVTAWSAILIPNERDPIRLSDFQSPIALDRNGCRDDGEHPLPTRALHKNPTPLASLATLPTREVEQSRQRR